MPNSHSSSERLSSQFSILMHDHENASVTTAPLLSTIETGFGPPQDLPDDFPSPCEPTSEKAHSQSTSSSIQLKQLDPTLTPAPVPLMTGAYHLTRSTLIHGDELDRGGKWDIRQWQPIFVKGVLELPATLSHVIHHSVPSLSAGMLAGKLVDTGKQGTVVLGRGKRNARRLRAWYGEAYVCVRATAEIELADEATRKISVVRWVQRQDWDGSGEVELGADRLSDDEVETITKEDTDAAGTEHGSDEVLW